MVYKRIVYTPYSELYSYEAKPGRQRDKRKKTDQISKDRSYLWKKWGHELRKGDPYYNPNLSLKKHEFTINSTRK